MNHSPDYESPYAIQHPVRSRYDRLLTALSDAAKASASINLGLGHPGEGRDFALTMRDALEDASLLEVEIVAGYFKFDDFYKVYPVFSPELIYSEIEAERATIDVINHRRVTIKAICEDNHWFEDEGHRLTAEEIPEA